MHHQKGRTSEQNPYQKLGHLLPNKPANDPNIFVMANLQATLQPLPAPNLPKQHPAPDNHLPVATPLQETDNDVPYGGYLIECPTLQLSSYCPYHADIGFELGGRERFDGRVVARFEDTLLDVVPLLGTLYGIPSAFYFFDFQMYPDFITGSITLWTSSGLRASVLWMSTRYMFENIQKEVLEVPQKYWPHTLEKWDVIDPEHLRFDTLLVIINVANKANAERSYCLLLTMISVPTE